MPSRSCSSCLVLCLLLVSLPAFAATLQWTGGVDDKWSNSSNWTPPAVPAAGDALEFLSDGRRTMTNDLAAGTVLQRLTFSGTGYVLSGNRLGLTNGVQGRGYDLAFHNDLTFSGVQTIDASSFDFRGTVEVPSTLNIANAMTDFRGPLNGSGTITASGNYGTIRVRGGGTFSGLLEVPSLLIACSLPNADVKSGTLYSISGEVRDVVTASLAPGYGYFALASSIKARSLSITAPAYVDGLGADLTDGLHDTAIIDGLVSLSGALRLVHHSGTYTAGQVITLIANGGSDAVVGTFAGLSEGATITTTASGFILSYRGGDGNDVTLTALASTKSWTGVGGNDLWSTAANWSPAGTPVAGQALAFPTGCATSTNDLATGLSFASLTFGAACTVSGSAFSVTNSIVGSSESKFTVQINAPITLTGTKPTLGGSIVVDDVHISGGDAVLGSDVNVTGKFDGSGSVFLWRSHLRGGGSFKGQIKTYDAFDLIGSFPDATVDGYSAVLSGDCVVGNTNVYRLSPGTRAVAQSIGRIETGSLIAGGGTFDVEATTSDVVVVHGSVNLYGVLEVRATGSPAAGTTYTILENDGTDAISGTFTGLAEGSLFQTTGGSYSISYKGGTGNDVTITLIDSGRTWTGAGGNLLWSNPNNWAPAGVPVAGESLYLRVPSASQQYVPTTNDLPAGFRAGAITVEYAFRVNGNPLTVTGGINGVCTLDIPIRLEGNQTVVGPVEFMKSLEVAGAVEIMNGQTRVREALNGAGSIRAVAFRADAGGSFSGTLESLTESLRLDGSFPNLTVRTRGIYGFGNIGPLTTSSLSPGASSYDGGTYGTITTTALAMSSETSSGLFYAQLGTSSGDRLVVNGPVSLGTSLFVDVLGGPQAGQTFVLIDNDGDDPVSGTFRDMPERAEWSYNAFTLRVTYNGGDGNDVAVTILNATETTLTQSSSASAAGQQVVLAAKITSAAGPSGSVSFFSDSTPLGTAPVENGTATLTAAIGGRGTHVLKAVFESAGLFARSTSNTLQHEVRGAVSITILPFADDTIAIDVAPVPQETTKPGGTLTLVVNGQSRAAATLATGRATFPAADLWSGKHRVLVEYSGDRNFIAVTAELELVIPSGVVSIGDAMVEEGDDDATRSAELALTLSRPSLDLTVVEWEPLDETAHAGTDYVATRGRTVFEAGEVARTVSIAIVNDDRAEDDETFAVRILGATNATIGDGVAQVRILTDDAFYTTHHDVEYARRGATPLLMTLRVPASGDGPFPVVLSIEAGWWSLSTHHGTRAAPLARRGFAVATIGFTPSTAAKFPAQLDDVMAAIGFLRANASRYGLDPSMIGVFGISAGGHLAALLANADEATKVQAIAIAGAPTDLTRLDGCGVLAAEASTLLGCIDCPVAGAASPSHLVSRTSPPFLIMHGSRDCEVPDDHARALRDALVAHGVAVSYVPVDLDHAGAGWNDAGLQGTIDRFFDQWMRGLVLRRRAAR